jgi:CheY-like chemotaxis protein
MSQDMEAADETLHLLVVDDYFDMAETLAALIVEVLPVPVTIDVGHDGREALTMALARPPAVAVMDIDMPIMSGIESAMAMRASLRDRTPLLIALTGNPGHATAMQTHLAFDIVLGKPVNIAHLTRHLIDANNNRKRKPKHD